MKKISVLHFELSMEVGGIEAFLLNILTEIDKNCFEFHFITVYDTPGNERELKSLGGNIIRVSKYKKLIQYILDLDKLLKTGKYDIIHIHKNSAFNIIPLLIARKNKFPVIIHSHNTMSNIGSTASVLHRINRMIICKVQSCRLACSEIAGKWMYGEKKDFQIIKNGILTEKFLYSDEKKKRMRKELKLPENAVVFGNIGRFSVQKNQIFLIDLFSEILLRNKNSYLLVVGDGALRPQIEEKIMGKGIQENVFLLGVRNDIPDLLNCMDALIMPSLYEGLPVVCIEAQASGLKLFLSDSISRETQITEQVYWFSLKDKIESIAQQIYNKCKNIRLENQRQHDNCIIAEAGFDIKKSAKELEKIYRNLKEKEKCGANSERKKK